MLQRTLKEKILLAITSITGLAVFPLLIASINDGKLAHIIVDFLAVSVMVGTFLGVWYTRNVELYSKVVTIFIFIITMIALYIKGISIIYWLYPAIIFSFYLMTPLLALLLSLTLVIVSCSLTYNQFDSFTFTRVVITLIITLICAFVFSKYIEKENKKFMENESFNLLRNKILELIACSAKQSDVLHAIVDAVENENPDTMCSILLLDKTEKKLTLGAAPSLPDFYNQAMEGLEIAQGAGSCGTSAYTGKRVTVIDIATHPYWVQWSALAKKANLSSCWSEPIIDNSGKVIGTFAIYFKKVTSPTKKDFRLIEQFVSLSRIAIEREKADQLIWHQANFDHLTQLPNRSLVNEYIGNILKKTKRENTQFTIAMLDIDNFKDVNDSLGHSAGDALLVETAKRIKDTLRESDIIARIGGDEFIIILTNTNGVQNIEILGKRISTALAKPYLFEEKEIYCTASIGVAIYPNDADNINQLLKNADQAMYGAKAKGRNTLQYFTENMRTDFLKRMQLIQDLRIAVKEQQFFLVYQPIVNLQNNNTYKAEALIRWQHPEKGLVSPLDFIPIAEETGLIIEISEWVFQQVLQDLKLWRGAYCENLQISINTSPVQYKNHGKQILNWVEQLKQHNIPTHALTIEITESLLMETHVQVDNIIADIRQQGVVVAIDDFGTGYCSFSYLKNFLVDYIKIDQSFVKGMSSDNNDMALCEAIIVMADKLNIEVIAEGIETAQQRQLLATAGCTFGQGYLLAKPLLKKDFEQFLINGHNEKSEFEKNEKQRLKLEK
ncbi:EAL domain-containing protein [Colwellia sp. MB02u-18]|uniref:bifunctional diguanylate cyclase/phosphodiesterase n=1 Tax=unclassified Colwellia TaxID=196834 RepID=UPI0015F5CB55|nr:MULTISPECIES: EAL domain-containing protein [unclassified Colwellia]MBA6225179.1 EAL domain-containing protein [Colwellia sp. MB3u-45]MBA6268533.1 EAL domain-containing protein [Colwellia sp. MB3u-43]MBA6320964.1 EAL domain-containing protein [Colwellia sp. MB02u-19]MBA6325517.1 EAL domain-containing protein [Colwellia sp. MB02u-18]MBA6331992.1 EAL domain-containing protein [Colwellia sp. MB02u-12]